MISLGVQGRGLRGPRHRVRDAQQQHPGSGHQGGGRQDPGAGEHQRLVLYSYSKIININDFKLYLYNESL